MPRTNHLKGIIACYEKHVFFHSIENGELGPATNLSMDSIRGLFKITMKDKKGSFMKFKSLIPENVLTFDSFDGSIIFYTEPMYKPLIFAETLGIPSAYYKIPFLLWSYKNKLLSVYALKTKPKGEDDILYNAPFMNINSSGSVCMGNVKFGGEKESFEKLMEDIVDKFFNSAFTHTSNNNLLKMNYQTFLKNHANDKNLSYAKLLYPSKYKIKDLL